MNGIQISSLMALIAGILIIAFPNILEILIAAVLIIVGVNGLIFGAKMNKVFKVKIKD